MGRWAGTHPEAREVHRHNLQETLLAHYRTDGTIGLLAEDQVDRPPALGGMALLGLALGESPLAAEFAPIRQTLLAATDALWRPDGSFVTRWGSEDTRSGIQFYPGEALTYWAVLFRETREAALHDRALKSLAWYKDWHLANRNPAFVPSMEAYWKIGR